MTDYALALIEHIEQHSGSGQLLAELYADENFSFGWRERQQQPAATTSELAIEGGEDE